ncbi:hypothetical protein EYF80_022920 [Liparis tanakae]|uniref:Uncharacterized protein n=1 Tax=Liparis tanakae TaxID=230148 RepID=A0A4Z2HMT2_9TELE|nr:hypothetical protein EYF80_022920 [Liparis tanakae]
MAAKRPGRRGIDGRSSRTPCSRCDGDVPSGPISAIVSWRNLASSSFAARPFFCFSSCTEEEAEAGGWPVAEGMCDRYANGNNSFVLSAARGAPRRLDQQRPPSGSLNHNERCGEVEGNISGKSLRKTGRRNSMNGTMMNTVKGTRRNRSAQVRNSWKHKRQTMLSDFFTTALSCGGGTVAAVALVALVAGVAGVALVAGVLADAGAGAEGGWDFLASGEAS